jgi:DNA-binding MarR family transcriptional regulator
MASPGNPRSRGGTPLPPPRISSGLCQDFDTREYEDQPIGYLLYRVMAVLRPEVTAELGPVGLGLPEFVCLRIWSMLPDQSSAELARNTNVSPQAMNLVLRGLQEMGAVTRPATVSSGRALPARLTSKGRALLKRAEAAVHVADERLLANLTPDERREFKRILHAVGSQAGDIATPSCISSNTASDKRANT